MKLLDDYLRIQKEIYEYFGYVEDWCVFPIHDSREYYWCIDDPERPAEVRFSSSEKGLIEQDDYYYTNEIYHQRFLPKPIYRTNKYTLIVVDTNTDGNKFLQIFDNSKEKLP